MNREDIIFQHAKRDGLGLEIGPSINPIARKSDGYNVRILDHLDQAGLVAKYGPHGVPVENIEEVDYVWDGRTYAELIGEEHVFDWIIASHVIEHTTDFIGFLCDCDTLLKDTGMLCLIVPDKRFCFDRFRPLTGLARFIDLFFDKKNVHSAGVCAEYFLNVVRRGDAVSWGAGATGEYSLVHTLADARSAIEAVRQQSAYLDVHEWCFTPTSFELIINDLLALGFIQLKKVAAHPTQGCEFYITLSRQGQISDVPRLEMLRRIAQEETMA